MRRITFLATCIMALCIGAISAQAATRVEVIYLACGGFIVTEFDGGGCIMTQWGQDCSGNRWSKSYAIKPRNADLGLSYNAFYDGYLSSSYYYGKFSYDPLTGAVGNVWGRMISGDYYEAVVE